MQVEDNAANLEAVLDPQGEEGDDAATEETPAEDAPTEEAPTEDATPEEPVAEDAAGDEEPTPEAE